MLAGLYSFWRLPLLSAAFRGYLHPLAHKPFFHLQNQQYTVFKYFSVSDLPASFFLL